jgi:hypothetical protein
MPRRARLDAPGTLHHVIIRGIERRKIVNDDKDRQKELIVSLSKRGLIRGVVLIWLEAAL